MCWSRRRCIGRTMANKSRAAACSYEEMLPWPQLVNRRLLRRREVVPSYDGYVYRRRSILWLLQVVFRNGGQFSKMTCKEFIRIICNTAAAVQVQVLKSEDLSKGFDFFVP